MGSSASVQDMRQEAGWDLVANAMTATPASDDAAHVVTDGNHFMDKFTENHNAREASTCT